MLLHADSKDSDQAGRMPRLIWVFAGRTAILLVSLCRGSVMHFIWFPRVTLFKFLMFIMVHYILCNFFYCWCNCPVMIFFLLMTHPSLAVLLVLSFYDDSWSQWEKFMYQRLNRCTALKLLNLIKRFPNDFLKHNKHHFCWFCICACNCFTFSSSCCDIWVNFFPTLSCISRYFATHLSIHTVSPFVKSESLYRAAIHFFWHAPLILKHKNQFSPNMSSGLFHPYWLNESISSSRGVWCIFSFLISNRNSCLQARTVDPDQTRCSAASDLGLYCLPRTLGARVYHKTIIITLV